MNKTDKNFCPSGTEILVKIKKKTKYCSVLGCENPKFNSKQKEAFTETKCYMSTEEKGCVCVCVFYEDIFR